MHFELSLCTLYANRQLNVIEPAEFLVTFHTAFLLRVT